MNPNTYYGTKAANYDSERAHKDFWRKENAFVKEHVLKGPVLDVPVGTGRYFDIYKSKGLDFLGIDISDDMLAQARKKDPKALLKQGTVYEIPYADDNFGTVVCSRLMHWLYPDDMARAMAEICRVGDEIIVSIRLGKDGMEPGLNTYTHDRMKFLTAASSKILVVEKDIRGDGKSLFKLFKFRNIRREEDFLVQMDGYQDGRKSVPRLAKIWCRRFGIPHVDPTNKKLTVEYWDSKQFQTVLKRMADLAAREKSVHTIITDLEPRRVDKPPVYFKSAGCYGLLDGRRRSNKRMREGGIHPVIVIDCDS